jgi:hypothetical protein
MRGGCEWFVFGKVRSLCCLGKMLLGLLVLGGDDVGRGRI